jgi:hypothetical protein
MNVNPETVLSHSESIIDTIESNSYDIYATLKRQGSDCYFLNAEIWPQGSEIVIQKVASDAVKSLSIISSVFPGGWEGRGGGGPGPGYERSENLPMWSS